MSVQSYSPMGTCNAPDEPGELVCVKPFPCMPLGFWPLPGFGTEAEVSAAQVRFHESYFAEFEGVWCECSSSGLLAAPYTIEDHGDHIIITSSKCGNGGGLLMLGRSDGVLYVPFES